ncbi:hypothetical protein NEF87_000441 [Candidatus Lokiarchaeum ossiferum]|uniref:Uncharacterized protein n=1 Tax=Candidatus Lokiarchaeum ossiferum TaxID=2951803 RepID=A0ABY6HKV0_9ARCH|nr:hypothetical protein NEF87_000441 [Candidatus Lokiarchaeum sp. B-35]
MKDWHTQEWKSKRKALIKGAKCSQCGKAAELQVHHNYSDSKLRNMMERRVVKELIKEKMHSGEIPFLGKEYRMLTCEKCGHSQIIRSIRFKNVTCKNCSTFQALTDLNTTISREYNYNLGRTGVKMFIRNHREEIERLLNEKNAPDSFDYMNLSQDTIVLCKTCHYALENGHDLCPSCKKNYKKIKYLSCWDCLTPEEKKNIDFNQK